MKEAIMTMFWTVLAVIFSLYFLTTMALLLTAKFKKNEKSNLILDPDSWHFKLCHPMLTREYGSYDIIRHKEKFDLPFNICPYAAQFFLMLYIGWPVLILWCCLKTLVYTPFMILFGSYPIANIESMVLFSGNLFTVDAGVVPLPEIKGHKIYPAYIILPITYFIGWLYFPKVTATVSIMVLGIATGIAVMTGLNKLVKTDQKEVSLIREWLSAKKNKVCWKLELTSAEKIQRFPLNKN